ncbi:Craniofacial development protein 2 [Varanus komodoensis]|nr:Craniofacial development protein 2 [Varanus komodoensis]
MLQRSILHRNLECNIHESRQAGCGQTRDDRLNIDILGISELKWTGMGEFNSDDHQVYYCGQESLRRNGVAFIVNKRIGKAVLGYNLQNDRMISVRIQGKTFNITVVQVYAPTTGAEEAEVDQFYEGPQHLLELTPKNDVLIILGDWNAKVGSQKITGITGKFGLVVQNEAGHRLVEFCQENTMVIANTLFQQPKRQLYTWTSPDGQHRNQIDYVLCSQKWRSSIQSVKTRPGADCGSDHELLVAKFRLKLKKVGKSTSPFRRPDPEDETQILWPPNEKEGLPGEESNAGNNRWQKKKGMAENEILDKIEDVQELIFTKEPDLLKALIPVQTMHLTIIVAHLRTEDDVKRAVSALEHSKAKVQALLQGKLFSMTFRGIGQFNKQVIYVKMSEDEQQALRKIAGIVYMISQNSALKEAVESSFREMDIDISGSKDFKPHLTLLKLSKAPALRRKLSYGEAGTRVPWNTNSSSEPLSWLMDNLIKEVGECQAFIDSGYEIVVPSVCFANYCPKKHLGVNLDKVGLHVTTADCKQSSVRNALAIVEGFRKIHEDLYMEYEDSTFGTEVVGQLDLCAMHKKKQDSGYYHCECSINVCQVNSENSENEKKGDCSFK